MKNRLLALALTASALLASPAHAVVTINGTVPAAQVDHIFFAFAGGNLSIATNAGSATLDPMIRLFLDNGSPAAGLTGTLIGTDDDSGPGVNSLLSLTSLSPGNYVLTVGAFNMLEAEARSGVADTPGSLGPYQTTFTSERDVVFGQLVPEPATWMTMLLGFAAIGAALRRRNRRPRPA
jgi:hypothetical protein